MAHHQVDEPSDFSTPVTTITNYVGGYVAMAVVMVANVALYRLAAVAWGLEGWSEYSLVRRVLALMESTMLLGFGVAVCRQVALANQSHTRRPLSYLLASFVSVGALLIPVVAVVNAQSQFAAKVLLGDAELAHLVAPLCLVLVGLLLNSLCYSYLQGKLEIQKANLLLVTNGAAVPLLAFYAYDSSVRTLLLAHGCMLIVVTTVVLLTLRKTGGPLGKDGLVLHALSLLHCGIRRIPGDLGVGLLLAAPAMLAAQFASTEVGGAIAFGTTLLSLAGAAVGPVALILLPYSTRLLESGKVAQLSYLVRKLLCIFAVVGALGIAAGELLVGALIELYLGPEFTQIVPVLQIMIAGALPYLIYCGLRGFVDAVTYRPLNARNTWIAIGIGALALCGVQFLVTGINAILISLDLALVTLAALTVYEVWRMASGRQILERGR